MEHENDQRLKHKKYPIYIVKNHDWAFAAWELEKLKGTIQQNATLIHVDAHLDNVPDGTQVDGLMSITNKQDIFRVTSDPGMKIENFIWAGIATDSIQNVMYVSHQDYNGEDINDINKIDYLEDGWEVFKKTIEKKDCIALRFRYIEDFKSFMDYNVLERFIKDKSVVLDLDLDYFNLGTSIEPKLMSDNDIYKSLIKLQKMYSWDMCTIALSPHFCGGQDNAEKVLKYFYKAFELKEDEFEEW